MKFSNLINLLISSSLIFLFSPHPLHAVDGQGGDAAVPATLDVKPELSSGSEGSVSGAPGPKAKSANGAPSTVNPPPSTSAPGEKRDSEGKKESIYREPSVLERFREYHGKRTPEAFMALFDQKHIVGFRQDPPVALSDGKTIVQVRLVSTPEREYITDVALTGGRVVAAMKAPEATNTWIIELLPEKGTEEASVAVMQHGVLMVFPLAVAPRVNIDLDKSGGVTEEDFRIFLRDQVTPSYRAGDLNGDGVRDFRDDYLFTANYLVLNPLVEPQEPLTPAELENEDDRNSTPGDTVEPLPPEVEPEEEGMPDM